MSHLADPSSNSPRHLAGLSSTSDYPEFDGDAGNDDPSNELTTLRDFNAKLLERISEIRRRNFELSKSDEQVREKELELTKLREQENKLRIKLSKLTDESWAKDLEIQSLKEAKGSESHEIARLQSECSTLQKALNEHSNRVAQSEKLVSAKEAEIRFISEERAKTVHDLNEKHANEAAQFRSLNHSLGDESQKLAQEIQQLRERLAHKETEICELQRTHTEGAAKIQQEVEAELQRHDQRLQEMQKSLEAKLQLVHLEKNSDLQTFAQVEGELNAQVSKLESIRGEQAQQISQNSNLIISLESSLGQSKADLHQTRTTLEQTRREKEQAIESLRYQSQERVRTLENEHAEVKAQNDERIRVLESQLSDRRAAIENFETLKADNENEIESLKESLAEQAEALKSKSLEIKSVREENLASLAQARKREEDSLAALDQKIETLRRQSEQDQSAMQRLETDLKAKIRDLESELNDKNRHLIDMNHFNLNLKKELESARADLQLAQDSGTQALWESNQKAQSFVDHSRKREDELNLELASLRADRLKNEKSFAEAQSRISELRAQNESQRHESRLELRTLREEAEKAFIEMQTTLRQTMMADFQTKFEAVLKENARVQALLDIKDNSADIERKDLQKRQVHLNLLEQQLKSSANILQNDRTKILSLSKQLATELQQPRTHQGAHTLRQTEERAHALMSIIKNLGSQI